MKIKKSTLYIGAVIFIVIAAGFFFFTNSKASSGSNVNSANPGSGETQKIVISMANYNYYPNTIKVKAGQPVSIFLDSSVSGCYRSFTIPSLGLMKNLLTSSDSLDFTPTKPGTYRFACAMGMGTGTLIVE